MSEKMSTRQLFEKMSFEHLDPVEIKRNLNGVMEVMDGEFKGMVMKFGPHHPDCDCHDCIEEVLNDE